MARTPGATVDRSGAKRGLWLLGTAANFSMRSAPGAASQTAAGVLVTNQYAYGTPSGASSEKSSLPIAGPGSKTVPGPNTSRCRRR